MRTTGNDKKRCRCCWDYLAQPDHQAGVCYRCVNFSMVPLQRGLYVGITKQRHNQIGVHAQINAKAGEVWRNRRPCDIPNDRTCIKLVNDVQRYMAYRCK